MISEEELENKIKGLEKVIVVAPRRSGQTTRLINKMKEFIGSDLVLEYHTVTQKQENLFKQEHAYLFEKREFRRKAVFIDHIQLLSLSKLVSIINDDVSYLYGTAHSNYDKQDAIVKFLVSNGCVFVDACRID
jgi:hypothetical protein